MSQWRYQIVDVEPADAVIDVLNAQGAIGWECFKIEQVGNGVTRLWLKAEAVVTVTISGGQTAPIRYIDGTPYYG